MSTQEQACQANTAAGSEESRHIPGEEGVWILIFGDMMVFLLFFLTYMYYRSTDVELYRQSQLALNSVYGFVNTLLLLGSSLFVAFGVRRAREKSFAAASRRFASAIACGAGFIIVKAFEYTAKVQAGILLTTNGFYMFYYMLTGIHLLHVVVGMIVLILLAQSMRGKSPASILLIEAGASYWHMVDLLWVVLFPLIYLLR